MLVVAALLAPGPAARPAPDPAVAADIVWAYAAAGDGLEHVRCAVAGPGIAMVLLVQAADSRCATDRCRRLLGRVTRDGGALSGWRLVSCAPASLAAGPGPHTKAADP